MFLQWQFNDNLVVGIHVYLAAKTLKDKNILTKLKLKIDSF